MWERAPSRALRTVALALMALVLGPLAAGCLGGEETAPLAVPTDKPISVPIGRPATPPPPVDFADPGYAMSGAWEIGDGWDYASNQSRTMRMRVVDSRVQANVPLFLLETTVLDGKGDVSSLTRTWVDTRVWGRVNHTDERGIQDRFFPPAPLRFYKNGTATFNHTRFDAGGKLIANESIRLQAYLHPANETVQARFGEYYEARKVEQLTTASDANGIRSRTLVIHWVHRAVLNDVAFQLDSGEKYTLTAYRAADTRRGTLAE